MPGGLKVVCGPFEALEPAFVAKLRAIRPGPGDAPVLVVAPSRVMADRLERLLVVESGVSLIDLSGFLLWEQPGQEAQASTVDPHPISTLAALSISAVPFLGLVFHVRRNECDSNARGLSPHAVSSGAH